ncbi:O-antigen ligase family protein [Elusimicrobiota bacterium]
MIVLLFLAAIIPFQFYFDIYSSYTSSIAQMAAVMLILLAAVRYGKLKEVIQTDPFSKAVIMFIFVFFLSAIGAVDMKTAFIHVIKWSLFILLFFPVVLFVDSKQKLKKIILALSVPAIVLSVMGIWQYTYSSDRMLGFIEKNVYFFYLIMEPSSLAHKIMTKGFNWYQVDMSIRAFGSFLSSNNFSQYIGLILPLIFGLALSEKKGAKKYFLFSVSVALIIINIITFSRGGWLGMIGMMLCGSLLILKKKIWQYLRVIACIFIMVLLFGIIARPVMMKTARRFIKTENSLAWRGKLWAGAIDINSRRTLLGAGPGNYSLVLNKKKYEGPAHSNYLQVCAEFGLLGLAVFIYLIFTGLKSSYRIYLSEDRILKIFGVAFFMIWIWFSLQSIFTNYIFGIKYGMMFWIMVGLNSALLRIRNGSRNDS